MFIPDLPSNRMIWQVRRDPRLFGSFNEDLEQIMSNFGLSDSEKNAFRSVDIRGLRDLGVHSYFLPQVTRLMRGSVHNDSKSQAAEAFRKSMIDQAAEGEAP